MIKLLTKLIFCGMILYSTVVFSQVVILPDGTITNCTVKNKILVCI